MSNASQLLGAGAAALPRAEPSRSYWTAGLYAAPAWALAAFVTIALPDVVPWGSRELFAANHWRGRARARRLSPSRRRVRGGCGPGSTIAAPG